VKIGILGAGNIGGGLARAWTGKSHTLVLGVRDPADAEAQQLARDTGAQLATVTEAARFGDVVVLALPFGALDATLRPLAATLAGKIVIDCTNAIEKGPALKYGHTTSSAEVVATMLPGARVFKAFNTQGAETLANPRFDGHPATGFFCGDDAAARPVVAQLVADVGLEALDVGPLRNARLLEPMTLVWLAAATTFGTRDIGFRLVRR
jgi:NADPH-dependent F420 reductase